MNQYPYMNPYMPQNFQPGIQQNVLPPQQILQANGRESVNALKMSPNSSALIADSFKPIIYKCISDSLGTTSIEVFDVTPHKEEEQIQQENVYQMISDLRTRIERLENESFAKRSWSEPNNAASHADEEVHADDAFLVEPKGNGQSDFKEQPTS